MEVYGPKQPPSHSNNSIPIEIENKQNGVPKEIISWFTEMGYQEISIQYAYMQAGGRNTLACQCGGDVNQMIQEIMYIIEDINTEDILMDMNCKNNKKEKQVWDPFQELKQLERGSYNDYIGLNNNANICYFNSILQAYFQNPKFMKEILSYQANIEEQGQDTAIEDDGGHKSLNSSMVTEDQKKKHEKQKYVKIVHKLQYILAQLVIANVKYINPYDLTQMFYNDCGNKIDIGEQKDISEFLNYFFTNIAKGIIKGSKEPGDESFDTSNNQQASFNNEEIENEDKVINDEASDTNKKIEQETTSHLDNENKESQIEIEQNSIVDQSNKSNQSTNQVGEEKSKSSNINSNQIYSLIYTKRAVHKTYKNPITKDVYEQKFADILEEQSVITLKQGNQDLYNAWDKYMTEENKEVKYLVQGVEKPCHLEKKYFFPNKPEQLIFIIDRVKWSTLANQGYKTNGIFKFDKLIYIDRFMKENKENIEGKQGIKEKKEQLKSLEEDLLNLQQFDKEFSLPQQIQKMHDFIKIQINHNGHSELKQQKESKNEGEDQIEIEEKENQESLKFECKDKDSLKSSIQVLSQLKTQAEERIYKLQHQISDKKQEIDKFYTEYKNHKYFLQSIFMHEGGAQAGHYYLYVQDFKNKKWMRFSDRDIQEVSEEKVMEEARGGESKNMSAYGLIYIPEDQMLELQNVDLFKLYETFISPELQNQIKQECFKQKYDYIKKANEQKVEEIIKLDYSRYSLINKWQKNNKSRLEQFQNNYLGFIPILQNFSTYLMDKIQSGETSFRDRYGKSLNSFLYNLNTEGMNQEEIALNDQKKDFIQKMKRKWTNNNFIDWADVNTLALKPKSFSKLQNQYIKQFNKWQIICKIHVSLYSSMIKQDMRETFNVLSYLDYLKQKDSYPSPYKIDFKSLIIVMSLRKIEQQIIQLNTQIQNNIPNEEVNQQEIQSQNQQILGQDIENPEKIQNDQELDLIENQYKKQIQQLKYMIKLTLGYIARFSFQDDSEERIIMHVQVWVQDLLELSKQNPIKQTLQQYLALLEKVIDYKGQLAEDAWAPEDQELKLNIQYDSYEPIREEILKRDCLDWDDDEDEDHIIVSLCSNFISIQPDIEQFIKLSKKIVEKEQPITQNAREEYLQN